jgi:acyl transferase domain-containing protein
MKQVAITGMSCRFPGGVETPAMFWDLLQAGRCTVTKVPFERWDVEAEIASNKTLSEKQGNCMRWGSFVSDLELFDASFFRISPAEASAMDPQQRLLLEYAYLAFVDAGYTKETLQGRNAGVFVGIQNSDVLTDRYRDIYSGRYCQKSHQRKGNLHSSVASRIFWKNESNTIECRFFTL